MMVGAQGRRGRVITRDATSGWWAVRQAAKRCRRSRRSRIVDAGVCVLVVCVVVVAGASSASAAGGFPGYYRCIKAEKLGKAYTGEYTEKECKTKATPANTGKYDLQEVDSGLFEATGKSVTLLAHSTRGLAESILCKRGVSRGELLDSDVYATDRLTLEGCVGNDEKKTDPCGNATAEEIQTSALFSTLVWLNKSASEPGLLLEGEAEQFAVFKCGAEQVDVRGYLVGAIENTRKGHTITYALSTSGQQAHRSAWIFGAEIIALNLYTQTGATQTETTIQTTQTQDGTGAY
jgi:hypothetical protein